MKELLTAGTITFPLKNAELLREVKQGALDYMTEVAPALEALMDEVERLSKISNLPDKVDTAFWDAFLCEVLEEELFRRRKTR
jgi:hypothetical protein